MLFSFVTTNAKRLQLFAQEDPNSFLLGKHNFNRLKYTLIRIRCLRNSNDQHVTSLKFHENIVFNK